MFGSPAEGAGLDFDWEITSVVTAADVPPKERLSIPALRPGWLPLRRRRPEPAAAA